MANLQKHRAHESLNTDTAATWKEQAIFEATGTTVTKDVSGYHTVHLQSDNDFYFVFATNTTDLINTSTSLYLKGGDTIYSLRIPHGLGNTVILQAQRTGGLRGTTTATATIKMVLS